MKVLVTGGAGFIGSHTVERLLTAGHEVTVLDDLSTGSRANLATVEHDVELLVGDIADPAAVTRAAAGCEVVVHLAAVASVEASVRDPLRTNRTNLTGTINVFDAAARAGARRVVYASSAAVYGEATDLPIREDAVKRPMSPYAIDKLAGEYYLAHFQRSGAFSGTAFRFFNVYGPRQDPSSPYSGVISVFLDRAKRGKGVTIYGDGSQTRDFVYVKDLVDVLLLAVHERPGHGPGAAQDGTPAEAGPTAINLASGGSVDLLTLVATVAEAAGLQEPMAVEFGPARQGDITRSQADVTALRERFGRVPSTALTDGLAATFRSLS